MALESTAGFTGPKYYDDCLGPLWFDHFAAHLVQYLPVRPAGDVLEIACGTGLVTRRLRERLDAAVGLVAIDSSKPMLDYARTLLATRPGISWLEADGQRLPFAANRFCGVVCGFGFMFMPDRQAALREARRVLTEGGTLVFDVWDRIEANQHALVTGRVLDSLFPGDSEITYGTPYDMGDPVLLRRLLDDTGFRTVRIEAQRLVLAGVDPRRIASGLVRGTPRATLIERHGLYTLEAVIDKVTAALRTAGGDPYHGPVQAVIVEAVAI